MQTFQVTANHGLGFSGALVTRFSMILKETAPWSWAHRFGLMHVATKL